MATPKQSGPDAPHDLQPELQPQAPAAHDAQPKAAGAAEKPNTALAMVQAVEGVGTEAVDHVAKIAADAAHEWTTIAKWLHSSRGNDFVQQVAARMTVGGNVAKQIASLSPEQRQAYDEIRAKNPKATEQEALKQAQMSRPLDAKDQQHVLDAISKLASVKPKPINPGNNPNVTQIEVSFDGTWDNKDEMAIDTNPALINDLFEGTKHYEIGVATSPETSALGGWFGAGISNRINTAYNQIVQDVNAAKQANPNAEVVLIVAGFSRGSAAARAFANVLAKRGIPDTSSKKTEDGGYEKKLATPRIGAMILFDTVGSVGIPGTNLNPGLDLSIPTNVDNVLHLTAGDEKRKMFPLSSAKDPTQPDDPRITELTLPGAHSDIGGSYANDYSKIPLAMADDYLRRAGANVKQVGMPDVHDPALRLHDTGGSGERTVYDSKNPRH